MSKLMKRDKGFTLIELVIVLAIAALIILVVLQAVGAAQRSNRDSTRKQEAARVVSLLEQYASNNGGLYPAGAGLTDPTGAGGTLKAYDPALSLKYTTVVGGSCTSPTTSTTEEIVYTLGTNSRDYSLSACLEAGGASKIH